MKQKPTVLVTRESIQLMLNNPNHVYVAKVVGRALVGLFERQTEHEQSVNHTEEHNTIGFAGCDGRSGSLTAKTFLKRGTLEEWQIDRWTKVSPRTGFARLCKYHKQLNEIAIRKAQKKNG